MMTYEHHLLITRPGAGTPDGMGGQAAGAPVTVYDAAADVQDGGAIVRLQEGTVAQEGDATAFAPPGESVAGVRVGDDAVVTWPGGETRAATVRRVVRLDEKVVLAYA